MNSISEIFDNGNHLLRSINGFFDRYIGCALLRKCNITKFSDGVIPGTSTEYCDNPIFRILNVSAKLPAVNRIVKAKDLLIDKILLCFAMTSAFMMFKTDTFYGDYSKDTFYRFDLLPGANWERLQLETARNVILDIESEYSDNHTNALVFDDSLYQRTRGKSTQLCGRVYDHTDGKHRLGYRMMTGGWTNGDVFIPFAQALLTTRKEHLMVGPDDPIDRRTTSGKRRALAKTKGTDVVLHMVKRAQKAGIPFGVVLFDTWFSNPTQLTELKATGTNVIAMIKKNRTKYIWTDPETGEARKLDVKEIYSRNKKRRGRSRYLLSVNVMVTGSDGSSIPAKLVYARNHSNRKDWVCFVCTDMSLDEESILRTYMLRWNIEVYFKVSKCYLKLRTECHSTSYDAITAHMVVVAIRYMILVVARCKSADNLSIGELFYGIQREIMNEFLNCTLVLILDTLLESVRQYFGATEAQINELVAIFISKLPQEWQQRFSLPEAA